MNLIIFGPPGSGKGTYSKFICEKFGIRHIVTGEILRNMTKENTKLANEIKKIQFAGKLVSDDLVNKIVENELKKDTKKGFILDGYPRTIAQIEFLEMHVKVDAVIN